MKRWLLMIAMFVSVGAAAAYPTAGAASSTEAVRFTDLQPASWAEGGIHYLADRGTIVGYGNGIYKPLHSITRAQAVTYLVRELYPDADPSGNSSFTDVTKKHMFYREIVIASEKGLAGGLPDGSFRPDAPISRGETAALLSRAYKITAGNRPGNLIDITGHWAETPIRLLASNGLVDGYPDGTFRPGRAVNRAEYAVFLARMIQHKRQQAIAAQHWDELLALMTLEEKAGQMLMPDIRMWQNKPTVEVNEGITAAVRDHRLGGLILFDKNIIGTEQLTTLNHKLQQLAGDVPFFIGIDQEGGVIKRIPGGTNLPGAMALGAARDAALSLEAGKVTGAELKALGINLNFAPVLDVNANADNPIIGIRSFGSDPDLVSELGTAFMKGLQSAGVMASAKHFPGHGDTTEDSHLGLPVVPHNRQRLEQVELRPFREAIKQGVDMIMTAHVAFPAIESRTLRSKKDGSNVHLPATLSDKVVTGLLRNELGFQGVVISDAFTMNAISEHFGEEEAVVMAATAGVDIILMPKDITAAFHAIIQAVHKGELEERQIDASVKRILKLKHAYGLFEAPVPLQQKLQDVRRIVSSPAHRATQQRIAESAVTVLQDGSGQLPYRMMGDDVIAIVAPNVLQAELIESLLQALDIPLRFTTHTFIQGESSRTAISEGIAEADFVIAASYQFRSPQSVYDWVGNQSLINDLNAQSKRYVLLSMGNPYELQLLRDVSAALAVYGAQEPNIAAGLKVIFGLAEARGVNPVSG
ncbi:glycoside hydrolase family 3 N-terminal domain-containing protein [Paenibacillus alkalitolerans]|uniref:glycoside hydrolase family 3 N-terminal domain-containing protein n=1 Tax=Paenibacillus alkalitolerans TaxID=2799335 RepID=UPI0018F64394|nr:glycoside hydrolase family 3 N-terminal domain-containing protein [Paenibacillus alkalitolerans]